MIVKRIFDLSISIFLIVILLPLLILIAMWVKIDSPGCILFRQVRVGQWGKPFKIYKFRTMMEGSEKTGVKITVDNDSRITNCGRFLRRYKLDELPQLVNVIKGEMSLVGPRPEVPRYMDAYPENVRNFILSVPPGVTDYASIQYRNEGKTLRDLQDSLNLVDIERTYLEHVLPIKLETYRRYVHERTFWKDCKIILLTIKHTFMSP